MLFGSWAQGKAREESDIDLIVVSNDFNRMNFLRRLHILSKGAWQIMEPIEARGYTPEEIAHPHPGSFLEEILKKALPVI